MPYQIYRINLQAEEELHLPPYKGSALRGGFGAAFKRIVCALRRAECGSCLLKFRCAYAYIFETFPTGETDVLRAGKHNKAPHPFVIEPPPEPTRLYEPGQPLAFNLILIGRGNDYLPYFVYAFEELGKMGLGKGRGRYRLTGIDAGGKKVYDAGEGVLTTGEPERLEIKWNGEGTGREIGSFRLVFKSPARIIHQRKLTLNVDFKVLVTALLRRFFLLAAFHCDQSKPSWDHKEVIRRAAEVATEKNGLTWWEWERYSSRQQTRMKMGGVMGHVTYRGDLAPFESLLRAGTILHVGKGTGFGLGKYELHIDGEQDRL